MSTSRSRPAGPSGDAVPRRRRRRAPRVVGVLLALVVAAGGLAAADVADLVPGPLTTAPPPDPDPWPDAPGATLPPAAAGPVLAAAGTDAPAPDPAALAAVLAPLVAAPELGPSRSVVVADAASGDVLLDEGASAPHQPASTAKVLTAAAALAAVGGTTTLPTTVVDAGAGADGVPVLALVAGGDVLLSAGAGDGDAVTGRAGLADLADAVAASPSRPAGPVALRLADPFAPTGPVRPSGWTDGDVTGGYAADVTGVAVDAGRLDEREYAPRTPDPGLAAVARLGDLLAERGVEVVGDPARTDPAALPDDAPVLGAVRSAPLAEVVEDVLLASDNTAAEVLALLVARADGGPVTPDAAARAVVARVAALGVDVDGVRLSDGSGLGDGSALTGTALVQLLAVAGREEALRPVLTGLPVAGLSGSMTGRLRDDPAARGAVRAKTGTLTGVTALAGGVVDADGRLLVFAVLADAVPATEPARGAVDDIAAALAACGCR